MNQNKPRRGSYIAWTFLPIIIAFVIQILVSIMVVEGATVYSMAAFKGDSIADYYAFAVEVTSGDAFNGAISIGYAVISIILFGYLYKKKFVEGSEFGIYKKSTNLGATILGMVLFAFSMQYVCNYIIAALSAVFPDWLVTYNEMMDAAGIDENISIVMALYAMVLGPIAEEFIFRGMTLKAAKQYMRVPTAIILQAFLFGAFHMNMLQGSYAFVLGLGLGYIMHLYDNLFITIIIHIVFNVVGIVATDYLPMGGSTIISFFAWVLGSLVVAYISFVLLKIGAKKVNNELDSADI